jgi:predicted membrane-bound spermidine synthase
MNMNIQTQSDRLGRILLANAVFCGTSGLIFALAARPLSAFLNTIPLVMTALGLGLLLYGAWVGYTVTRPAVSRGFTLFLILTDSAWVLLSLLLLILPIFDFAADTKWAIGITAIVVDLFATLQFLEWRRM